MEQAKPANAWNVDGAITRPDGRRVGVAEYGRRGGTPVLWCHGAPGSRLEPSRVRDQAFDAGFHLVGVDRPGYGLSTPEPGRTIESWMDDGLAVADALGLKQFYALGVSTGGAYALALAALHPERVMGVIACCAMTDMRFQPARDVMSATAVRAVWDAADRREALRIAADVLGADGSKLLQVFALAPSDAALFQDPQFLANAPAAIAEQFKQGVEGYTDDRIADRDGWIGFDPAKIVCPVLVLQGAADTIVDVIHAKHTAQIVPTARLRLVDQLGHLSIFSQIVPALTELRNEPQLAAS